MKIPFKAVAVDMDGTFLNDNKKYNHELFADILTKLENNNIKFIVASGNQYYKTIKDFNGFEDRLNFVSENGSFLVNDGNVLGTFGLSRKVMMELIHFLQDQYSECTFVVSGQNTAYVLDKFDESFLSPINGAHFYYPKLVELDNLDKIPKNENLLKITVNASDQVAEEIVAKFNKKYGDAIYLTSSGNFAIDLMSIGISKASGLKEMLQEFGIAPKDLIAFGDGGNDISMLELAGLSYAMENATDELKKVADHIAPNNNEQGVLKVLKNYLS